jgi:hypothetical protein
MRVTGQIRFDFSSFSLILRGCGIRIGVETGTAKTPVPRRAGNPWEGKRDVSA